MKSEKEDLDLYSIGVPLDKALEEVNQYLEECGSGTIRKDSFLYYVTDIDNSLEIFEVSQEPCESYFRIKLGEEIERERLTESEFERLLYSNSSS